MTAKNEDSPVEAVLRARKMIERADYLAAYRIISRAFKRWPNDFQIRYVYAAIMADYAETLPLKKRRVLKQSSARIMRGLLRSLSGKPYASTYHLRNEYYYQSGQFKKQFKLGVEGKRRGIRNADYSQGVGAAWYSKQLFEKGQRARGRHWANVAIKAWKRHVRIRPDYYNCYVHFALAYGLLGQKKECEIKLLKAGKLSNKDSKFWEFEEIRKVLKQLNLW